MSLHPQACKAEIILAIQLVTRHRACRLAAVLGGLALLGLRLAAAPSREPVWMVAGTFGAIAGSRVLARGAGLASGRAAAAPWRSVGGRFTGVMLVVAPLVVIGGAIGGTPGPLGITRDVLVGLGYSAVLAAVSMGGSGILGASSAATLGVFMSWVGQLPPVGWELRLGAAHGLAAAVWRILPMAWRATALWDGDLGAAAVLGAWAGLGLAVATFGLVRRPRLP